MMKRVRDANNIDDQDVGVSSDLDSGNKSRRIGDQPSGVLFKMTRVRKPQFWQCIELIAPSLEKKNWKSVDAVGAWCVKCNKAVPWKLGESHSVQKHMEKYHKEMVFKDDDPISKKGSTNHIVQSRYETFRSSDKPSGALFKMSRVRKPQYWQCIELVAPTYENKDWKNCDAVSAWCTVCKFTLPWKLGESHAIQKHMEKYHGAMLGSYASKEGIEDVRKYGGSYFNASAGGKAHKSNQLRFEVLMASWLAGSLRSPTIVQDPGFESLVNFVGRVRGSIVMPTLKSLEDRVKSVGLSVMQKVKESISKELDSFSVSIEVSNQAKAIVLKVNYLNSEFVPKSFALDIVNIRNGEARETDFKHLITTSLNTWDLSGKKLILVSLDNEPNGIKVCNSLHYTNTTHIDQILYLTVDPFLRLPKLSDEESHFDVSGDITCEKSDGIKFYKNDSLLSKITKIDFVKVIHGAVGKLRTFASKLNHSPVVVELLKSVDVTPVEIPTFDLSSEWFNIYMILDWMVKNQMKINSLMSTSNWKTENPENSKIILTEEEWAGIEGICILLQPFYDMVLQLRNEKYSSLLQAFPLLLQLKSILQDKIFTADKYDGPLSKRVQEFKEHVKVDRNTIENALEKCRQVLVSVIELRFSNVEWDLLWTSILDPRQAALVHLENKPDEKAKTRSTLVDEILAIMNDDISKNPESLDDDDAPDSVFDYIYRKGKESQSSADKRMGPDKMKALAEAQIENYFLRAATVSRKADPLEWWNTNKLRFPHIARIARKYFACESTAISSKRIFYTTRNQTGNDRSSLLVQHNLQSLELPADESFDVDSSLQKEVVESQAEAV